MLLIEFITIICISSQLNDGKRYHQADYSETARAYQSDRVATPTKDQEETIEQDGIIITVIPVWKWLLIHIIQI